MSKLLLCNDCGWTGSEDDCVVTHKKEYPGYTLWCPKCDSENLIELMGRGVDTSEPLLVPC